MEEELLESFQAQACRILEEYAKVREWIRDSAMNRHHINRQQKQQDGCLNIDSNILRSKNLGKNLTELIKSPNKKVGFFAQLILEGLEQ